MKLCNSYHFNAPALLGDVVLCSLQELVSIINLNKRHLIVIDAKLHDLYSELFDTIDKQDNILYLSTSEGVKDWKTVNTILEQCHCLQLTKEDVLWGIGGGVLTDIVAFAASIWKRGCRLRLVPTTFVGMIDAAIGGKTGIHHDAIKNCLGSFYPAERVIISHEFLDTLPPEELFNGWAEAIKMYCLQQDIIWDPNNHVSMVPSIELILTLIEEKLRVCSIDLTDKSDRRLLNLGHTFGHVIESVSDFTISHGQAVAIGMKAALHFSQAQGLISSTIAESYRNLFIQTGLEVTVPVSLVRLVREKGASFLQQDKKKGVNYSLIVFTGWRSATLLTVTNEEAILESLISALEGC